MLSAMLLALLLVCHSAAAWQASDETIRVVADLRRQGLSGSTARNAAAEMIKSKLATQTTRRRLACVNDDSTTDRDGDTCSSYYDSMAEDQCGLWDDDDFTASEQCCACGGTGLPGGTPNPTAESERCVNDDSTTDSSGDTCSLYYDLFPSECGFFDDEYFTASERCCACGGGLAGGTFAPTPASERCVNDDSTTDIYDNTCSWYDSNPRDCGSYDDDEFTASERCCACLPGGTFAPTTAPTTSSPTATPAPTVSSLVADDDSIREAVALWLSDSTAAEATYGHISRWETGGVTDMSRLFCAGSHNGCAGYAASSFNDDITAWDTSGVTSMFMMFYVAEAFNQDIGDWAVHGVTDMTYMFEGASAFDRPLKDWEVSKVTSMYEMFSGASSFNQDIGDWAVGSVMDMRGMFFDARAFNQSLSAWRVDNVTDMRDMFHYAESFNQPLGSWRVDNVTDMGRMFAYAKSFDQPLNDWRLNSVVDISYMFWGASAFDQDLGWNVCDQRSLRGGRRLSCFLCGPFDLDKAFYKTKCESKSCGVSDCNTDAAPARRISVATAVAALVSVLIA